MGNFTIPELARDLIINIINIIILYVIVRALVYKPVKKFLAARTEKIAAMNKEAEDKIKQAEKIVAEHEEVIKQSKADSAELIRSAEHTAKDNSNRIVENAKQTAKEIVSKAKTDIEEERIRMISSMQEQITQLAVDISKQILKRELNDDDNIKIAADFFSEQNIKAKDLLNKSVERIDKNSSEQFASEKTDIASLAVDISQKILSHNVTDDDNLKIAEDYFNQTDK